MTKETPDKILMACEANISRFRAKEPEEIFAESQLRIDEKNLCIQPRKGFGFTLSLREIASIEPADYRIRLTLSDTESIEISGLGYQFEDFLRILCRQWNELHIQDRLWNEKAKKTAVEAQYSFADRNDVETGGTCTIDLYETALVVIPTGNAYIRIHYSDIESLEKADLSLRLALDGNCRMILRQLGWRLDETEKVVRESCLELDSRAHSFLRQYATEVDPGSRETAARLLREGKPTLKNRLDKVSPTLWKGLERKLESSGLDGNWQFLKKRAWGSEIGLGWKRGLMGDLAGDYLWVLVPLKAANGETPVIALETFSLTPPEEPVGEAAMPEEGEYAEGRATYLFQLMENEKKADIGQALLDIGHGLREINFRREPIYLPATALEQPCYEKYRFALAQVPLLSDLRRRFLGRVIHASAEGWRQGMEKILTSRDPMC